MRHLFIYFNVLVIIGAAVGQYLYPPTAWAGLLFAPILILGWYDMLQKDHTILRNFPVLGHFRFLFELIRPEIHQYFVASDTDGVPFDRDTRSLVYQRAKDIRDTVPFGTKENVYDVGYEWVNHSMAPVHNAPEDMRVTIGGPDCTQPYSASLLNISAMSYGALSKNAILALSAGAKQGNFAHNTGEGGISPYHVEGGADLIWQIGTGYFGCRTDDGDFSDQLFEAKANLDHVKMIEVKLSQGAKPGHGGILPVAKLSAEIAAIRHVPMGQTSTHLLGTVSLTHPGVYCISYSVFANSVVENRSALNFVLANAGNS